MSDRPIRKIFPGQSFRSKLRSTVLCLLTDPSALTVELLLPDGSTIMGTPVRDSVGMWHADFVVPSTMRDGVAVHAWETTGSLPDQNAYQEREIYIRRRSLPT